MAMKSKSGLLRRVFLGAALSAFAGSAAAQNFPSQPVRIVVPAPPGGTLDVLARIVGEELQPVLGQPVII